MIEQGPCPRGKHPRRPLSIQADNDGTRGISLIIIMNELAPPTRSQNRSNPQAGKWFRSDQTPDERKSPKSSALSPPEDQGESFNLPNEI